MTPLLLLAAHTITFWVEPCKVPETGCSPSDPQLAEWALEAWKNAAGSPVQLRRVSLEQARIRIHWASAEQGRYGEAEPIVVNGEPGAEVYVRPDLSQLGRAIAGAARADPLFRDTVVYLTCLHETGHALGLAHTAAFDDIMYSFGFGGDIGEYFARYRRKLSKREDIRDNPGISPADRERVRGLFR